MVETAEGKVVSTLDILFLRTLSRHVSVPAFLFRLDNLYPYRYIYTHTP